LLPENRNKLQEDRGAQGIEAEIPQGRYWAGRGIAAESPVFYGFAAKNALLYHAASLCTFPVFRVMLYM
jgi:hypothetical protein